jgi:hypothetical protein
MDLQEISDRLELQQLIVDYANAIDARQWDKLDRIFTPDAYIDYRAMGGIDGKYPAIKAWLPEALKHFPAYMHFVGNFSCEIAGDGATGKVACFNPMVIPRQDGKGVDTMFLGLWYVDKYQRTKDGWRIAERVEQKCYDYGMPDWMKKALKLE